jgi:hypothetical protein
MSGTAPKGRGVLIGAGLKGALTGEFQFVLQPGQRVGQQGDTGFQNVVLDHGLLEEGYGAPVGR